MGEILISGNGKGNSAIFFWWFFSIICTVVFGTYFCFIIPNIFQDFGFFGRPDLSFYCGIVVVFLFILSTILIHRCIAKTEIRVCENGVEGKGVGKYFIWGDYRVRNFRLTFDQIIKVDTTKNAVIIYTSNSNSQYKCYAANVVEIQKIIFYQRGSNR